MALGTLDERDLLLPLYGGTEEEPLWEVFLQRLLARTRAQRLWLFIRPGGIAGTPPIQRSAAVRTDVRAPAAFDLEAFSEAGLLPYAALRQNRVYSLEETRVPDSPEAARRQRAVLNDAAVSYARFIRMTARGEHNAWIVLLHDRRDFGAADSALLSSLAPHVTLALAMLMETRTLRLRAAIAEDALSLIGVGQAMFDADGRVVLADAIAAAELDVQATGRPQVRAPAAQAIATACGELAQAPPAARRTVQLGDSSGKDMLLRRAPVAPISAISSGYSVGLVRRPQRENATSAAQVAATTLGLSPREGALAEAMSQGRSIVEAGAELQLTPETARNYSKRIYAKTGASGQADLVRMLLTGLTPFA